ncbi:MAG: sugar ABC transporter substrate-binding protein [Tetrasphaera sp.]|nr:sugar ABC transporter substrate-binding protein [Tetrasphaera sp.]
MTMVAAGLAATLAACSSTGTPESSGTPSSSSGEIKLEFWTINLKEGYTPYIDGLIKAYEAKNPKVKVTWVDISDYQQTQSRLLAALTSGESPDVVNVTPFILPLLADKKTVLPLSKIGPTDSIAADYTEGFWNAGVLDGEAYAVPYYGSSSALLYNKSLFEKAGLDPAKPPTTWDEVFAAAKTIHAKTGKAGFVQTLDDFNDAGNTADILASQAGVPLLAGDNKKATFNTPQAAAYFDNYVTGVKDGWISKTSINGVTLDGGKEFAQGEVAMMFNGPWLLRWLETNSSPEVFKQIGLASHPKSPTGKVNAFLQQLAIPAGSKNPEQALDFARYVSGTVIELAKSAAVLPTKKQDVANPEYLSLFGADVLTSQPIEFFWPKVPTEAKLLESLRLQMQAALLGKKSSTQALDDAAKEWDAILAE